jgi:hypothetical protein
VKIDATYLVCAYYTDAYRSEVESLVKSLEALNIPHFVKHYASRGFWEANTRIKPEFLLDCLSRFPDKNIVYLDADSVVRSNPALFENFDGDLAVYVAEAGAGYSHKYLTGTIFLRNSAAVRGFVQSWVDAQKGARVEVDQDSFETAVSGSPNLRLQPLPAGYTKIFDRADMGGEVVIEHFQASRKRLKLSKLLKRLRNVLLFALLAAVVCGAAYVFVPR